MPINEESGDHDEVTASVGAALTTQFDLGLVVENRYLLPEIHQGRVTIG
jgi:hypothetical protein